MAVLLCVNLVNYMDRQVLYVLLPLIQRELALSDARAGWLASAFMIVYMIAATPIGYWADRGSRRFWIVLGIALWSAATFVSGLAPGYVSLFAARAAVGIGESCFGALSPSFVAEHFRPSKRGSVLALFSMAIPVGSALGYVAGGAIGQRYGWRSAFFLAAVPGLLLAALAARLRDPRGDEPVAPPARAPLAAYVELFRTPSFALVTLAGAAMTFGLGGFAVWIPSFFHRAFGLDVAAAGTLFGGVTVVSGVAGSLAGGWLSDWALKRTSRAYFIVSGLGLLLGTPFAIAGLSAGTLNVSVALLFIAELLLFLNMGPLNAIIVNVSEPHARSMAFAANMLVIHALGDAVSPAVIGLWSDRFGLRPALIAACFALTVAAGFCFWGTRHYDQDARHA